MNVLNKINLVNLPVKDQILKVDQILESFILDGDNIEIYTNEEILIKYLPTKALKKNISIKISMSDETWKIKLIKKG